MAINLLKSEIIQKKINKRINYSNTETKVSIKLYTKLTEFICNVRTYLSKFCADCVKHYERVLLFVCSSFTRAGRYIDLLKSFDIFDMFLYNVFQISDTILISIFHIVRANVDIFGQIGQIYHLHFFYHSSNQHEN